MPSVRVPPNRLNAEEHDTEQKPQPERETVHRRTRAHTGAHIVKAPIDAERHQRDH